MRTLLTGKTLGAASLQADSLFLKKGANMAILSNIEPQRVFYYFEEICKIPHASYNSAPIAEYLQGFAKEHSLRCHRDEYDNIVIFKDASAGYEDAETVIIQGHSDMVAEKVVGSQHDFATDSLKLLVEGDYLKADGTTLGGDDGIAVAYALAMLEDATLESPALEVVITANEEVGLLGATQMDMSILKGTRLINLDSEEEGVLLAGCAGGLTACCVLPSIYQEDTNICFEITIDGLNGGHSGIEINKNRANANILMGRLLHMLDTQMEYSLAQVNGGNKDNVIANATVALILTKANNRNLLNSLIQSLQLDLRNEYLGTDDNITISINDCGEATKAVLQPADKAKLIFFLMNVPFGVQKMSGNIVGLVETSANLGCVQLNSKGMFIKCSVRSLHQSAKLALAEKIEYLTEFLGGEFTISGEYPAWEYQPKSSLQKTMTKVYQAMTGKEMEVIAIHAGLECGIFYDKIANLDCVSLGPDVFDVHSPNERLSISSVERTWKYLRQVLAKLK